MVGVSGGRLDFAADEQSVLVRDEKFAVERNLRPARAFHERAVRRYSFRVAFLVDRLDFLRADASAVIFLEGLHALVRRQRFAGHGEPAFGEAGDHHADHSGNDAALESVASALGDARVFVHPARAAALHVSSFEVFGGEGFLFPEKFEHSLGEHGAGGPGFIHAGVGEDVRAAAAFADARVAFACEARFAATTGFLQGFRAPRTETPAFDVFPDGGMQHPVLQVAVGRARRVVEPRGHENSHRGDAVRMHVEKSENFGLGISECVQDRAGFERATVGEIDDKFHAERPIVRVVSLGNTERLVELLSDRANRTVGHDGETRAHFHTGHESVGRLAVLRHALIDEPYAGHAAVLDDRFADGAAGPDLRGAGADDLLRDPLGELSHREDESAVLFEEVGRPRQFHRMVFHAQDRSERADGDIGDAHERGSPAGADWIEEVKNFFVRHGRGHRDVRGIEVRETFADRASARDNARDAEAEVVRTLVAQHLQRQARGDRAFDRRGAVGVEDAAPECREESAGRRTEADAHDVGVHARTFDGGCFRIAHCG